MRKITDLEEIKQIQLDILIAVHHFCEENRIKYSLSSGSLIGAVRHKGFIPWDDDIDICLLRKDYDRLIKLFPKLFKDRYELYSLERTPKWCRAYGRVCDNRTLLVEDVRNNDPEMGIGIDVFIMDDVPDDISEFRKYDRPRRFLLQLLVLKTLKWRKERAFLNNLIALLGNILLLPFSSRYIAEKLDKACKKCNGNGFNRMFESCDSLRALNTSDKHDFDETILLPFEGYMFRVMKGYDDCLRNIYGDYMQLPPVEKRVTHHAYKVWWKE